MNRRRAITVLDIAALTLASVGAINWALSAANFNVVRRLFGRGTILERAVYGLVGLAGLDLAWLTARIVAGGYQTPSPEPSGVMQRIGKQVQMGAEQAGREVQRAGRGIQQTGQEIQRGTYPQVGPYEQPGMRP